MSTDGWDVTQERGRAADLSKFPQPVAHHHYDH
jgi:hypothetical protein